VLISFLRREAPSRDETRTDSLARSLGVAFAVAGSTGLLSLVFPAVAYGSPWLAGIVSALALAIGGALLTGALNGRPPLATQFVLAFATLLISAAVYAGGAPESGAMFFYLWVTPYAFALSTRRQAAAQGAWLALCSGAVLTIQERLHPGIGSIGELAGLWFIELATALAVGVLVLRLSRSLRDVDARFHRAFRGSQIGAAFVSTDVRWLEVNDALCRMLGRTADELIGRSLLDITAPDDRASTSVAVALATQGFAEDEKRYVKPNGDIVWVALSATVIRPETGAPYLFVQYKDITDHRRDRDALAHQAVHDPLTGLFNRTLLLDRLGTGLARGGAVGVILLDLDEFKLVNDSLGHRAGDDVLIALAQRLTVATAPTDTLARLGGDEFVVLCEGVSGPLDALDRASRLSSALSAPVELPTGRHTLTASIGVATSRGPSDTAEILLADADAAMYRAKAAGRGRIEIFDHTMRDEAVARLQLEGDLQLAAQRGQFVLEYQPIVDTHTLRPVALEALIRWDHPDHGRMSPDSFIPVAEETGSIHQIGDWVIATACAQLAEWQRAQPGQPELQVSVNVSPMQLAADGFVNRVADLLRRSTIAPGTLCLEITETVLVAGDVPAAVLAALRALGIRILLDDFGTGYSSLAYLMRFPINTLKIDQAFVAELDGTSAHSAITKAILAIARELELGVVAEGVEKLDQLEQLRALGCPFVQGYAISKPMPATDVPVYLAQPNSPFLGRRPAHTASMVPR
jgi:diguanylate cyclase (GGDEF)-like protein/PAS domain S-box-containing protein